MGYDYIHEVLQDRSIEDPARSILVRFHHKAYRPAGFDFVFPARDVLVEVLSETEHGALEIARCHHRLSGEGFEVEHRPWRRNMAKEVYFDDGPNPSGRSSSQNSPAYQVTEISQQAG